MTAPTPAALDALRDIIANTSAISTEEDAAQINLHWVRHIDENAKRALTQVETLTAGLAETRKTAGFGCDAANSGPHAIIKQGKYQFCHRCGETVRTPALSERARQAEARALAADTARASAEADRDQWREAHAREYQARIATEMEQSAAVSTRVSAETALAETMEVLKVARAEIARHNEEYQHRTRPAILQSIDAALEQKP